MSKRLAKKIAQQHIELRYPQQPLRLQPDYGEKNGADFLGDFDADEVESFETTAEIDLIAKDHEESGSYMSRQNLREMSDMANFIVDDIGMEGLDDWVEDKISQSYSNLNDVARYRGYRDDHPHGEESFKFAGRKATPFEIVTNWFAQVEEESEGEIEYMIGVDGDDEMSGDVEIFSGHDIPSLIQDLKRDLRWSNIEFSKSGRRSIRWSIPTQSSGFEGEHFKFADDLDDEIIDDMGIMADFDKESRVKSHKHHSKKDVKDSYEKQKKNFGPEWAKYEGAMGPNGLDPARIKKNQGGSGTSALDKLGPAKKKPSGGGLDALSRLANDYGMNIDDLEW